MWHIKRVQLYTLNIIGLFSHTLGYVGANGVCSFIFNYVNEISAFRLIGFTVFLLNEIFSDMCLAFYL